MSSLAWKAKENIVYRWTALDWRGITTSVDHCTKTAEWQFDRYV